jgi:methylated-DNA-[protein]-cysteine S-methyltransferase
MKIYITKMPSPIGELIIASSDKGLLHINFNDEGDFTAVMRRLVPDAEMEFDTDKNDEIVKQLQQYFAGHRTSFDIPFYLIGTEFQKKVWRALCEIPFGQTASYKEIARRIKNPNAMRAVGQANNKNPIPIVIPCHRIIGANGSLVGYGGGLEKKQKLLSLEYSTEGLFKS